MIHIARKISVGLLCLSSLVGSTALADSLAERFERIPDDQRVAVYWYWMSDNISVEGVQHDLEAMKKAGITRAYIGNIWQDEVKPGRIKVLTPEWWKVTHAALKRAGELGIEIGIFNCPGWSQSGGPWIKPGQSMRYLKEVRTQVVGNGKEQIVKLPELGPETTDVKVLAMPCHTAQLDTLVTIDKQTDKDQVTDIHFDAVKTLRNITLTTTQYLLVDMKIQAKKGDRYEDVKTAHLERINDNRNVGFMPWAPISISLPDVQTQDLRLIFTGGPQDCHFQARVTDLPQVERYAEKSLAKMFQSPLPMWGEYMWSTQQEPQGVAVTQPSEVIDLTAHMQQDGTLVWKAPKGRWTILRTGMAPTGVTNAPASKEATGYEVDKMSRQHVATHFDAFLGEILRRIPAEDRTTFKIVVEDSYETGGLNWTDDMAEAFRTRYGYDPIPYLPTLYGTVIGSQDQSERFLWDLRRLIADRVAYDYVGGLREVSNRHGLTTWLECYGHWGFPSEFLMYGGQSDEVAGEFWSEGSLGDIENRA
ncbi:MAG: glycoside hydrolase family 2, partial [Prevotellaceae bacterium]|nr:glycoside hydrolase family 2 [Prevotellaceae bacterium]